MNRNFIAKLETSKYLIGSFDAYLDVTKELIESNINFSSEEADMILKSMPTTSRAAITDKEGNYIGYLGLFDVDSQNNISSIRFEVNNNLSSIDKKEILTEFRNYLNDSLNINDIEKIVYKTKSSMEIEKKTIVPKNNIIISDDMLVPGVTDEILEVFSQYYKIPKLQMPFTIMNKDKAIGIIGLSNLIWANKRANLNIFLDKKLGSDITSELSTYIIDDYINYVHDSNIHNIMLSVNASNQNMIDIVNKTKMNYYGQIPFSAINEKSVESSLMFQHIPKMKQVNGK